ncbi:MAG: RagB/SusD family nutrient uptake outer membrane protein [Sphingobacteriales bacterium]|nr:RagB/SusD family nutrient uptake outer membrane protein [Sphingobacteriales bacterium]
MKRQLSYPLALLYLMAACTLQGCDKNLKEETYSTYDQNTLTKPENGQQAVVGAYAGLKDNGGYGYYAGFLYWLYEYPADVVTTSPVSKQGVQLDQLTYDASNSIINNVWGSIFRLISRTNEADALINNIDYVNNGSTAAIKNQHLGEVRFLRALAYFDATDLWGDVPLIRKPSSQFTTADMNPKLTSQAIIEDSMITDLKFAKQYLPAGYPPAQIARATTGAASALLTRLYMRRGEWQNAADEAQTIIQSGQYDLRAVAEGGIQSLFYTDNRADNEFIFVLKSSSDPGAYTINSNSFGINSLPWDYNRGWGNFPIHLEFYALFDSADDRKTLLTGIYKSLYGEVISVPKAYGGPGGSAPDTVAATYVYNLKYPHINNYNYAGFNNVTILRYADVLLMRAEALNEINGPTQESIDLVNQVRNRSKLPNINLTDYATKQQLRDKIFDERNLEFFMEGRRRDDLLRWGRSATNGASPLSKFKTYVLPRLRDPNTYSDAVNYAVYPYPQSELQANTSLTPSVNNGRVRQ